MKRKNKIIIGIITAIILLGIVFGIVDYNRIKSGRMPIFMVRVTSASETKLNYIGLGYRMQRKVGVSYKQEIYMDDYVKFGTWFYINKIEVNKDSNDFEFKFEIMLNNDVYFLLYQSDEYKLYSKFRDVSIKFNDSDFMELSDAIAKKKISVYDLISKSRFVKQKNENCNIYMYNSKDIEGVYLMSCTPQTYVIGTSLLQVESYNEQHN